MQHLPCFESGLCNLQASSTDGLPLGPGFPGFGYQLRESGPGRPQATSILGVSRRGKTLKNLRKNSLLQTTVLAGLTIALGTASAPAMAQVQTTEEQAQTEAGDRIVVTGSRLRRDEFSSISPLQVIDAGEARLVGLVDAGAIIADAPTVSGAQLDGSVQAGSPTAAVEGVPATGLGGNAVALRGLGAERTLLLVNGRRLAPSGVRGAPVAPDLNLIPGSLIDRVEILTDGASSIYGADAVAGVANVILRTDVDGLEFTTFATFPERDGGEIFQFGMVGGASNDRGNFTVALEYYNRNAVIVGDRPNFNDCRRDIRLGTDGNVYSTCADSRPANSAFVNSAGGFVFLVPGFTPAPGSVSENLPANWAANADLLAAGTNFRTTDTYTLQNSERETNLLEELERVNIFATGYQDINIFSRDTFYFEASYASRNSTGRLPREQVFPTVPGFIPMEDANGNIMVDGTGAPLMFANPQNPFGENALPVITLADFPQRRTAEVSNMRFVFGLEGDLALAGMHQNNWVYDAYVSYDRSFGTAWQNVIIDPHLRESINTLRFNNAGELICGTRQPQPSFGFPNNPPCVPINFFSPTLFTAGGGDGTFATQAEADYLFGRSITTTTLEQAMVAFTATGDVFEMPAGTVGLVLGAEFRELRISSLTDIVRSQGLGSSEVPDLEGDTIGRTSLWEMFVETELPVFDFFDVNLSGRYTSEENFGSEFTYSIKGDLRPTDWFRIRSTYGTTFRAPNLREQFLAGQAGTIAGGADPCIVPTIARLPGNIYDPTQDPRSAELLANCVAAGADPTALGLLATTGIPTTTGGNPDAEAETSESFTFGVVVTPPISDRFDLNVSVTYFDIEINDTLRESNPATILAQCYGGAPNLGDPACARITRAQGNPATATITNVDASFINIGRLTARGLDYNARFAMPVGLFGYDLDFTASATVTQMLEQAEQIDAASAVQDFAGTISSPEWRGNFTATLGTPNWMALWRARYIGEGQQLNTPAPANPTVANACGIIGVPAGVLCSPVDFTGSYWQHDLSISFDRDNWSLAAGVINIFDEAPPLITQGSGPARMNIVVQSGHDLIGRRAFINLSRRF